MKIIILALFLISSAVAADQSCKIDTDCKKLGENFVCMTVKTGCPGQESDSTCASLKCVEIKPKK